ncbi:MAG: prevent-host-death family protein [Actinomycetaceae bacterium]|nr:prevent-host-death family protein [Actinomycetaceae bacterium]
MVSNFFSRSRNSRDNNDNEGQESYPEEAKNQGDETAQANSPDAQPEQNSARNNKSGKPAKGSRFGKGNKRESASAVVEPERDEHLATSDLEEEVGKWRSELEIRVREALEDPRCPRLDLSAAHPGGLAQLYAQRPTPLSSLFREKRAREQAEEIFQALTKYMRSQAFEGSEFHLAIGTIVNAQPDGMDLLESHSSDLEPGQSVPALLRSLIIGKNEHGYTLQLGNKLQLSAQAEKLFARQPHLLDKEAIVAATYQGSSFTPATALNHLRKALKALGGDYEVKDQMLVGQFVHPLEKVVSRLRTPANVLSTRLVRALAGDNQSRTSLQRKLPEPNKKDRDPWRERGIGTQLPEQLDQVEAVASGISLALDISGGSDPAGVIASMLADAAKERKRALYVGTQSEHCAAVWRHLQNAKLGGIVARLDGSKESGTDLVQSLVESLDDNRLFSDREQIETVRTELRRVREALEQHTQKLHQQFEPWAVTPYDALQVLTDLTTMRPGPRTEVRFSANTLTRLAADSNDEAKTALRLASEAGMFSRSGAQDPWFGAVISSPEQVRPVVERVEALAEGELEKLRIHMTSTAGQTGLDPATSFAQWEEQLHMLEGIREALDVFQPAIFERSPADMVIATASKQWRRENGVEMKRSVRKRLTKQAQDLVRPGRHVEDLHEELRSVQSQREVWRRHCEAGGWPKLPANLDEMVEHAEKVQHHLNKLNPHLGTAYGNLAKLDIGELSRLIERLNNDHAGASHLPQRIDVLKTLHRYGLDTLVKDLRQRNVPTALVEKELDLAWWASALGVMLNDEPSLGGLNPSSLQNFIADFKRLDAAHVESLAAVTADTVRRSLADVRANNYSEERQLREALSHHYPQDEDAKALTGHEAVSFYRQSDLAGKLLPIVIATPLVASELASLGQRYDLVIVERADTLSRGELATLLAQGRQAVITIDVDSESENSEALRGILPLMRVQPKPKRVNSHVGNILASYQIDSVGTAMPTPRAESGLNVHYVEGRGMPAPGTNAVESTDIEVETVVDLVVEHALVRPEKSLAVVCLNKLHAEHVEEQVQATLNESPALQDFFLTDRSEPFTVIYPGQDRKIQRDHVILTVGYAKTTHGRVLHHFGQLSSSRGASLMAQVLSCARADLTVVSSVHPGEFDRRRFAHEGPQILMDLLEAGDTCAQVDTDSSWPTAEAVPHQLLIDLADRLFNVGLNVVANVGSESGMRIPLAIGHPAIPGEFLVAILTDDAEYVAEPSLRRRDRYWPATLEKLGWKTCTELSMAVFIDPQKECDEIVELVLDAVDLRCAQDPQLAEEIERRYWENVESSGDEDAADAGANRQHVEDGDQPPAQAQADEGDAGAKAKDSDDESEQQRPEPCAQEWETAEQRLQRGVGDSDIHGSENEVEGEKLWIDPGAASRRGPRPDIAPGLPLAAYSDDQLDDMANWIRSDGEERTESQMVEELQVALGLTRRGAQVEAVLGNVARRTAR